MFKQLAFLLLALCLLSCDRDGFVNEEALLSELQRSDSTFLQIPPRVDPEIEMPLPSSTEDTIIVKLELQEGWGPFQGSMAINRVFPVKPGMAELDPSTLDALQNNPWKDVYETVRGIPDTLTNVRIVQESMQLEQAVNHGYRAGLMDEGFAMGWFREREPPSYLTNQYVDQWVSVLIGETSSNIVVIFDTNNDESFEGEQPLLLPRMPSSYNLLSAEGWDALPGVRVSYEYFDGSFIRQGQSYLKINPYHAPQGRDESQAAVTSGRDVLAGPSQFWKGNFAVNGRSYGIALSNSNYGGMFKGDPLRGRVHAIIDSTEDNGFYLKEGGNAVLDVGEPIILRGDTFHVADITMYGDALILVKGKAKNEASRPPYKGQVVRDFSAVTIAGDSLKLFEYLASGEKYILLDFWGSWCGPCLVEFPKLKEVQNQYDDRLSLIGIALDEKEALALAVEEYEVDWPQIQQSSMASPIIKEYHVFGFPTYFLIGPDSTIVEAGDALRSENLSNTLATILN